MANYSQKLKARLRYKVYQEMSVSKTTGEVSCRFKYYDSEEKKHLPHLNKTLSYKASSVEDAVIIQKFNTDLETERTRVNSKNGLCKSDAEKDFIAFGYKIASQIGSQKSMIEQALSKFVEFTGAESFGFEELEEDEIFEFAGYLQSCLKKWGTAKEYLTKFKYLIKRARGKGLITHALDIDYIKIKKGAQSPKKNALNSEEINTLLATPCGIDIIKLAFLFMCYTGLRISDLLKLKWGEIIKNGIGTYGKTIISFEMKKTGAHLDNLVNERLVKLLGKPGNENDKVFAALEGISNINYYLQKWARAAGITKHISAHCGRVTFATMLYLATKGDINVVMRAMGHTNSDVTWRYVNVPKVDEATLLPEFDVNFDLLKNNGANGDAIVSGIALTQEEKPMPVIDPSKNVPGPIASNQELRDAVKTLNEFFNKTDVNNNEATNGTIEKAV